MPNAQALVRVVDEFLWALRREGFDVSPAQAIDAARAVKAVGIENPQAFREAIACVVVQRPRMRNHYDAVFDAFFRPATRDGTLWDILWARGFDEGEIETLRALIHALERGGKDLLTLIERSADLNHLLVLAGVAGLIDATSGPQLGFYTHRLLHEVGLWRAHDTLSSLRSALIGALGARGLALANAIDQELARTDDRVREFVRDVHAARLNEATALSANGANPRVEVLPFSSLNDAQLVEVVSLVRRLAERLRRRVSARRRTARASRIDPRGTLRRSQRTDGVPVHLLRLRPREERLKVVILCDVSDSVRPVAHLFLHLAYAIQESFKRVRSFVFVSEVGEVTALFRRERARTAIPEAWRGAGVAHAGRNSNYGRMLRSFEANHMSNVDGRTIVVILGDGRTNFQAASADVVERIRQRARAVVWLCPEERGQWAEGDSAMLRYAPFCTAVYEVRCAADLCRAALTLLPSAFAAS